MSIGASDEIRKDLQQFSSEQMDGKLEPLINEDKKDIDFNFWEGNDVEVEDDRDGIVRGSNVCFIT